MIKCADRFLPDTIYVDECEPNREEMVFIMNPDDVSNYANSYTQLMILHHGAVEFKTLKEDTYDQEN